VRLPGQEALPKGRGSYLVISRDQPFS